MEKQMQPKQMKHLPKLLLLKQEASSYGSANTNYKAKQVKKMNEAVANYRVKMVLKPSVEDLGDGEARIITQMRMVNQRTDEAIYGRLSSTGPRHKMKLKEAKELALDDADFVYWMLRDDGLLDPNDPVVIELTFSTSADKGEGNE